MRCQMEEKIKTMLKDLKESKKALQEDYDRADANDAVNQPIIMQKITLVTEAIERLEKLLALLEGGQ